MVKTVKNISDIFVKKIVKKWQKILLKDEIIKIWMASGWSENRLSYALSLLKNLQILTKISQDLYLINSDSPLDFYWQIVSKIIAKNCPKGAIIGGEKGIELHLRNAAPPEILVLYNDDLNARIRLFDGYEVHFRTIKTGEKTDWKNFFPILKKFSQKMSEFVNIFIPRPEIAILELLSIKNRENWQNDFLLDTFLRRNHKTLENEIFVEIARYKYIRSINRLRAISRDFWYQKLYHWTLDAIKISGGGIFLNL